MMTIGGIAHISLIYFPPSRIRRGHFHSDILYTHTLKKICIDEWESVGPGKGIFLQKFGGFVDPNCLLIDKELCWKCISLWNIPQNGDAKGMSADRNIFNFLKNHSEPGSTGKASAFYLLDPND